jgi:hypothetical protein
MYYNNGTKTSICSYTNQVIDGNDDTSLLRRRTIARYTCLMGVLTWRDVSGQVRKRFPTCEHIVTAGLITHDELEEYYRTPHNWYVCVFIYEYMAMFSRWMLPTLWISSIFNEHVNEHKVAAPTFVYFTQLLYKYREHFKQLHFYDWVCIPLVYTQVMNCERLSF